jgi:hypothetical protein
LKIILSTVAFVCVIKQGVQEVVYRIFKSHYDPISPLVNKEEGVASDAFGHICKNSLPHPPTL